MMLDVSDKKTVFQSGLYYKVIQTLGRVELDEDDILELRYMTLDSDEQKVMQSIIDSWEDEHDFLQWHNSENNTPARFGHAGNKSAVVNQYVSAGKQHLNRSGA